MRSSLRTALDNAQQLHASIVALPNGVRPTVDQIIRAYARLTDVRVEDLAGPSKAATISHHRHLLMYLIRRIDPVASYELIGRHLGGRDMATIHEAVAKISRSLASDPSSSAELLKTEAWIRSAVADTASGSPPPKPWQLLAAAQVLRDQQMTDAEARKVALSFLEQLEAAHG